MLRLLFLTCINLLNICSLSVVNAQNNQKENNHQILFIKDDYQINQSQIYYDILDLGYGIDVELHPDSVTLADMQMHELTILSGGSYQFACGDAEMRLALQSYILEHSGKVIIEGGHNGYISAVYPFYLGFRNKVMMIDDWVADNAGDLIISSKHSGSVLANVPNKLASTLHINYSNVGDQDACTNNKFSDLFYRTAFYDKVGILIAPDINNARIINYFFNYSALVDRIEAKKLLQNSIYNLIGDPVSVFGSNEITPTAYMLSQNFPNPFNPETILEFTISDWVYTSLIVYNSLGIEVAVLVNERKSPGKYSVKFDGTNYPSGIYFYELTADNFSQRRKMCLIK